MASEQGLIHLIYYSTASHEMEADELLQLLNISRERNARLDLTGMLLYGGGVFLQVLEGLPAAVDSLYRKIEMDPRHHSLILVEQDRISERSFPDWSMGFQHLDILSPMGERFAGAFSLRAPGEGLERLGLRPGVARDLLLQFAKTQR